MAREFAEIALRAEPARARLAYRFGRQAADGAPRSGRARAVFAFSAALLDREKEATAELAHAVLDSPNDAVVQLYAGRIAALRAKKPLGYRQAIEAARAAFRRSAELDPGLAAAHAELGFTFVEDNDSNAKTGLAALRRAEALRGRDPRIQLGMGALFARLGDPKKARSCLNNAISWAHGSKIGADAKRLLDALEPAVDPSD
jgi:hypothetical protein